MKRAQRQLQRFPPPGLLVVMVLVLVVAVVVSRSLVGGLVTPSTAVSNRLFKHYKVTASLSPVNVSTLSSLDVIQPAVIHSCANNTILKLVLVSISQRHIWACNENTTAYDSPVITGMAFLAADLTPTGNYHVFGKQTNLVLKGSDSTGSWNDYVHYWMPFLDNRYGTYGFHDATWRDNSAFGAVSPDSSAASHGCVELPLTTAAWLYDWAPVGTTVTIVS